MRIKLDIIADYGASAETSSLVSSSPCPWITSNSKRDHTVTTVLQSLQPFGLGTELSRPSVEDCWNGRATPTDRCVSISMAEWAMDGERIEHARPSRPELAFFICCMACATDCTTASKPKYHYIVATGLN